MKNECQATLAFLGLYNFIATKVEVINTDTNQYEAVTLADEGELEFTEGDPKELTDGELDTLNMWLYLKEKFNISNEAWHEFAMNSTDVPTNIQSQKE